MHLVDTNILSEAAKVHPTPAVMTWLQGQKAILVSAISLIEIEFGIVRLPAGRRRDALASWFEDLVASPDVTLVSVDATVARAAARLRAGSEAAGRTRPSADLIIAASALVSGAVLVTRNTKDFEGLGVPLLNPFLGPG